MSILVAMDEDRQTLCLEVAWEIDALARLLPELVPNAGENDRAHFLVRGVAGRLVRLSHVLMGALGDVMETTDELAQVISLEGGEG